MPAINASSFLGDLGIDCKHDLQKFESLGKQIADGWKRAFDAAPIVLEYLHKRGWSVSNRFTAGHFIAIHDYASKGEHGDVDKLMSTLVGELQDKIFDRLIERFPTRLHVLKDAFQAHNEGKYTLSIPVLLSQADGIGCEIFSISNSFFTLSDRTTAIDTALSSINPDNLDVLNDYKGQLLLALKNKLSVHEKTTSLADLQTADPSYGPLNRHGVLHGLHVNYATQLNSMRCIIFLDYIMDVQDILLQELPRAVDYETGKQEQIRKLWARVRGHNP